MVGSRGHGQGTNRPRAALPFGTHHGYQVPRRGQEKARRWTGLRAYYSIDGAGKP